MVIRIESAGAHDIEHFARGEKGGRVYMEDLLANLDMSS